MNNLTEKEKQFLAFSLFMAAMRIGPDVFGTIQSIVTQTGIQWHFEKYARDWVSLATTVKQSPDWPFKTDKDV